MSTAHDRASIGSHAPTGGTLQCDACGLRRTDRTVHRPRFVRVPVALSVLVDRDAYALAYGADSVADIREYVRSSMTGHPFADDSGVIAIDRADR